MKRAAMLLVICSFTSSVIASDTNLPLTINGLTYSAVLTKNSALMSRISTQLGEDNAGEHYRGKLESVPNSWVRASKIEGEWQGIASLYGELYVIAQSANALALQSDKTSSVVTPATALTDYSGDMGNCGVEHNVAAPVSTPSSALASTPASAQSITSIAEAGVVTQEQIADFCGNQIDGICLLPELPQRRPDR